MNPRLVAHDILLKLEQNFSNSTILVQQALLRVSDPRDRNLVTDLVLGILRWRGKLLFWIERYADRPRTRIDAKVSVILQIAIYQLVFQKVAAHAAINEGVDLCRKVKVSSAAPFVNGILRRIQRELPDLPEPDPLFVRWSHPEWLASRWEKRFGTDEATALMKCNNTPPPVYLRVNEMLATPRQVKERLQTESINVKDTDFDGGILEVVEGAPQKTRAFGEGLFYIQDAAIATLARMLLDVSASRVLEIAAAPGGKTLQLALRLRDRGWIASLDSDLKRMRLWQENMARLEVRSAHALVADGKFLPFGQAFDCVVIDAPCSSLGVIRRHPEIKWWRKPEHLPGIQSLQKTILSASARVLPSGGTLIYSVCSFEPEETAEVTATASEFEVEEETFLYPHISRTDGFYFARLRKR